MKSSSYTDETLHEYLPDSSVVSLLRYNALCFVSSPELAKYPMLMCFRNAGSTYTKIECLWILIIFCLLNNIFQVCYESGFKYLIYLWSIWRHPRINWCRVMSEVPFKFKCFLISFGEIIMTIHYVINSVDIRSIPNYT